MLYSYFSESCIHMYLIYNPHYIIFSWPKDLYIVLSTSSSFPCENKCHMVLHLSCFLVHHGHWLRIRFSFLGPIHSLHRCCVGLRLVPMKPAIFIAAWSKYSLKHCITTIVLILCNLYSIFQSILFSNTRMSTSRLVPTISIS